MILSMILREMERLFGSPEAPHMPADVLLLERENPQVVHTLAYLYRTEMPENPWRGQPVLLEAIRKIAAHVLASTSLPRRAVHPLMHAFRMVRADLGEEAGRWKRDLARFVCELLMPELRERERLTAFTSANVGYGTNHLAVELSGLTAYIAAFRDDPDFERMDPGGSELVAFADAYLKRFMAYMHPDGYWAECDGPALSYNTLTAMALYAAARDLKAVETYREDFEQCARFHCATTLPNLTKMSVAEGRNPHGKVGIRTAAFGFACEGQSLSRRLMEAASQEQADGASLGGEQVNCLLMSHLAREHYPDGEASYTWDGGDIDVKLSDDFAFVRRGGWIASGGAGQYNHWYRPGRPTHAFERWLGHGPEGKYEVAEVGKGRFVYVPEWEVVTRWDFSGWFSIGRDEAHPVVDRALFRRAVRDASGGRPLSFGATGNDFVMVEGIAAEDGAENGMDLHFINYDRADTEPVMRVTVAIPEGKTHAEVTITDTEAEGYPERDGHAISEGDTATFAMPTPEVYGLAQVRFV